MAGYLSSANHTRPVVKRMSIAEYMNPISYIRIQPKLSSGCEIDDIVIIRHQEWWYVRSGTS